MCREDGEVSELSGDVGVQIDLCHRTPQVDYRAVAACGTELCGLRVPVPVCTSSCV